ncbi:putative metal-binding motif-containing protein [Nanoarchaeota archaeon]
MKTLALLLLAFILAFLSISVYSQQCDHLPRCEPNITSCGCGGTKTRATLCEGGCSDWYKCSVDEFETECADQKDNDCDQLSDCDDSDCSTESHCRDSDNDGFPDSIDCDDGYSQIHPGAQEQCNNLDDDCDNLIDEDLFQDCGLNNLGICRKGEEKCMSGTWQGCDAIFPQEEVCDNIDNDCDGNVDEGCECAEGDEMPCGTDVGACSKGVRTCGQGAWSPCMDGIVSKQEICGNNIDDDCDGDVDEDCPVSTTATSDKAQQPEPKDPVFTVDNDKDAPVFSVDDAAQKKAITDKNKCIDNDGDGYGEYCKRSYDCDDSDASINPGAREVCNNRDDDCNNIRDDSLTRACGISNIGICVLGTERCSAGKWTGCTAVLPSEEVCGNRRDDNCNGDVDENCRAEPARNLTNEEFALTQFLDLHKGKGTYDIDRQLDMHRKTKRFVNVKKRSVIMDGRTRIHVEIVPTQDLKQFTVYEYIPKFIAESAADIQFSVQPEIIQDDPLVAWHFDELKEKADLYYEVEGGIEDAHEKTSTLTIAEETTPRKRPWYFDLIPLISIPILGFLFIILVQIAHRRKTE